MTCSIWGCNNQRGPFYHIPPRDKENRYISNARIKQWKSQCQLFTADVNHNVCREHFFLKEPADLLDVNHPDWIPWLKLTPNIPDDPIYIQNRMQKYYELGKNVPGALCVIKSCANNNKTVDPKIQSFNFPTLETDNYVRRVLSEKRLLLWMQLVDQRESWEKYDIANLKICSLHFITGKMAELTDVDNVDWLPTRLLNHKIQFEDHVTHFDLHNLISLVKDAQLTDSKLSTKDLALPVVAGSTNSKCSTIEQQSLKKPKINVGLKCVLCLTPSSLKPLQPTHQSAVEILFKEVLRVESELICSRCSKFVDDFFDFYEVIVNAQQNASNIKLVAPQIEKNLLKTDTVSKKSTLPKKDGNTLFEALPSNEYRCTLCGLMLAGKKGLNNHLYQVHKVKIHCKLCKKSFTPDEYSDHKGTCFSKHPNTKLPTNSNTTSQTTSNLPQVLIKQMLVSKEKHSCYICLQHFTPDEMKVHIKTHLTEVAAAGFDKNYDLCKQCKKAIHKNDMQNHKDMHDKEREEKREMLKKQQEMFTHKCDECPSTFKSLAMFEQHKKRHASQIVSLDDRIECPDCGRIMTARYYKFHCRLVHDDFQLPCDKCGKQMSRTALKRHRQTTCGDEDMVACDICGKSMRAYLLKGHVSTVHSNRTRKCSFCPKVFGSKEYALSHERWSHKELWKLKKRSGVKELNLNRDQLVEALGFRMGEDSADENETCPVCLNVHGSTTYVETHMRAAHHKEYISMIMGGMPICSSNAISEPPSDTAIRDDE